MSLRRTIEKWTIYNLWCCEQLLKFFSIEQMNAVSIPLSRPCVRSTALHITKVDY